MRFSCRVPRCKPGLVGEESEYWDRFGTDQQLAVGVGLQWSEFGYKTFLKWVQVAELPAPDLLAIALAAAKEFDTEVAAGDVLVEAQPGLFMVATPDGTVCRAVEISNGDQFELVLNSSPVEPFQIKRFLGQNE